MIPFLSVKPQSIRLKVRPSFPANLLGGIAIVVSKANGVYTIDLNYEELQEAALGSASDDYIAIWDSVANQWFRIKIIDFVSLLPVGIPEPPANALMYGRVNTPPGAWARAVALAGDVMTGFLTLVADPLIALHAATKQYVDSRTREKLAANRDYWVGFQLGVVAFTPGSPVVCNKVAHGLAINDNVVFNIPQNSKICTISAAAPAVITMANTFAAGQPVRFTSTGYLPSGIARGVTYYVIAAGLSGAAFQISATPGGAAINTTAITATFTNGSAVITTGANHNAVPGSIIRFAGTSVINFANATDYYVQTTPAANTMTVSAAPLTAAIVAGVVTTNGTLVQQGEHWCDCVGALPAGITEGTPYFVIAGGFGANAFQFSATLGGAAINAPAAATGTPVYTAYTGNDTNIGWGGVASTKAVALLTIQKALDLMGATDQGIFSTFINLCNGTFNSPTNNLRDILGSGVVQIIGDSTLPSNVIVNGTVSNAFLGSSIFGTYYMNGFEVRAVGAGFFTIGAGLNVLIFNVRYGACSVHNRPWQNSTIQASGATWVIGAATRHVAAKNYAYYNNQFNTIKTMGQPAVTIWLDATQLAGLEVSGNTYIGQPGYNCQQYTITMLSFALGGSLAPGNTNVAPTTGSQVT